MKCQALRRTIADQDTLSGLTFRTSAFDALKIESWVSSPISASVSRLNVPSAVISIPVPLKNGMNNSCVSDRIGRQQRNSPGFEAAKRRDAGYGRRRVLDPWTSGPRLPEQAVDADCHRCALVQLKARALSPQGRSSGRPARAETPGGSWGLGSLRADAPKGALIKGMLAR